MLLNFILEKIVLLDQQSAAFESWSMKPHETSKESHEAGLIKIAQTVRKLVIFYCLPPLAEAVNKRAL